MEAVIGKVLGDLGTFLFGPIMLAVFFGVGLYFTIRLHGVQFTRFGSAFREVVLNVEKKSDDRIGQISSSAAGSFLVKKIEPHFDADAASCPSCSPWTSPSLRQKSCCIMTCLPTISRGS